MRSGSGRGRLAVAADWASRWFGGRGFCEFWRARVCGSRLVWRSRSFGDRARLAVAVVWRSWAVLEGQVGGGFGKKARVFGGFVTHMRGVANHRELARLKKTRT